MTKRERKTDSLTKKKVWSLLSKSAFPSDKERRDSYVETYPEFVKYFKKLDKITYHDAVIGAHAVYGWMPTILTIQKGSDHKSRTLIAKLLNTARSGDELKIEDLEVLKAWMNNSIVGVSKLLHFINPELYPIWDSNINAVLYGAKRGYRTNDIERYLEYRKVMLECARNDDFKALVKNDPVLAGNRSVSALRLLEVRLFYLVKSYKS